MKKSIRLHVPVAVAWSASIGALCMYSFIPANADERDDAVSQRDAAAQQVSHLKTEIDGIDATLSQLFYDLEAANAQIPAAQKALDATQAKRDAANREHEVAMGQLQVAQAKKAEIDEEIHASSSRQEEANKAIGNLARSMYQDGTSSAVLLALTKNGTESIDDRASAADAMARSQAQALNAAMEMKATQRSQASRQQAISDRVAALEAQAQKALDDAAAAEAEAQANVDALEKAKADAQVKQAEWDAKKSEVNQQLAQAQADYDAQTAKIQEIDAANRAANTIYSSANANGFHNPVQDSSMIITSPFGWRMHPVLGYQKFHSGVDFGAQCGEPIYAMASGVVLDVSSSISAGNYVDVNHGMLGGNSVITEYLHMQRIYVSPGQSVSAGTVLGEVGMTGYATGCHLHFGVLQNGVNVDPMGYL